MDIGVRALLVAAAICGVAAVAKDEVQPQSAREAVPAPAEFVNKAAQDGMAEVTLGNVAMTRSQDAKVKEFAQRMVTDHSRANQELTRIATGRKLMVPKALDAEHQKLVQELSAKTGTAFDTAYGQHMYADHEKAVGLFEAASRMSDAELAGFAARTLPTLREHRQLAAALPGAMAGAHPAAAGAGASAPPASR